jgi:hypothetical protein
MANQIFDRDDESQAERAFMANEARRLAGEDRAKRLEADARALRAVRVLDRWAGRDPALNWIVNGSGWVSCRLIDNNGGTHDRFFNGPDADAARIAAAEALEAEDPSLGEGL